MVVVAGAAVGPWQKALAQLQQRTWGVGRVPSVQQWLDFFAAAAAMTGATMTRATACTPPPAIRTAHTQGANYTPPLPRQVSLLIAESLVDAARLARLQQLLLSCSTPGVLQSGLGEVSDDDGARRDDNKDSSSSRESRFLAECVPEDVSGVFLSAPPHDAAAELVELLFHWCAAHDTPRDAAQLLKWLHEVSALLHFFTLHPLPQNATARPWRLCLAYTEMLSALHRALCTIYLRPQSWAANDNRSEEKEAVPFEQDVALLALWLLRESMRGATAADSSLSHADTLQLTQRLLASHTETQSWLLQLPAFLRGTCGGRSGAIMNGVDLDGMLARSSLCQLVRQVVMPPASLGVSPNVCVPFIAAPAARDTAVVRAMSEQLSRIASGG
ncbi:hypothetical protein DQ04_08511010 [Trypanosoma grayi]|uniref:hypothetical protein n=1 Tax=Trypanosoma grayi TaxID=71804 RepID=UPI0004F40669|nr:hypothetical protein DQ04_08511010 [Trypanosoma grayi]KEG07903.1 hypothetical protein DQ04_08511010 [Trypanosoma grayi]